MFVIDKVIFQRSFLTLKQLKITVRVNEDDALIRFKRLLLLSCQVLKR